MSDETNREQAGQPNQQTDENVNPDEGNERVGAQEAEGRAVTESNETAPDKDEALAFYNAAREANITDPKAWVQEFTRRSQENAELKREQQQWQTERQKVKEYFEGQQRRAQNPSDDLWEAYENEYDPDRRKELRRAALDAERAAWTPHAAKQALEAWEFKQAIKESADIGGISNENEIAQMENQLGIKDRVLAIQLLNAHRSGNLRESLNRSEEARKSEDLKRKRTDSLLGSGSAGAVPGGIQEQEEKNVIDPGAFYAMSPSARKKKYGMEELPLR